MARIDENDVKVALQLNVNDLYAKLGEAQIANDRHFTKLATSARVQVASAPAPAPADVGKNFFDNLNRTAYDFFCGNGANAVNRQRLQTALGISDPETMIIAVATVLSGSLGWAGWIAVLVATLLFKILIPSITTTICDDWGRVVPNPKP